MKNNDNYSIAEYNHIQSCKARGTSKSLLNYKNKSTININLFNFFNKYNFIIYILHKFILDLLIYLNIVKYHSISDLFGSLIIIYIIYHRSLL